MKLSSKNLYPSLLYKDLLTPETSLLFQRIRYILPAFHSVWHYLNKSPACKCHRSHRNWSIFQNFLKVAVISKVIMGEMIKWREAGTALPHKPCLLKKVLKKSTPPQKKPLQRTQNKTNQISNPLLLPWTAINF